MHLYMYIYICLYLHMMYVYIYIYNYMYVYMRRYGTRLVNFLKCLTVQTMRCAKHQGCFIVTQADNSSVAVNFWQKQQLGVSEAAAMVVAAMHRILPSKNHV